jgi:hypothetical protein
MGGGTNGSAAAKPAVPALETTTVEEVDIDALSDEDIGRLLDDDATQEAKA